jgi:lysophospholipase L1-like esterase
MKAKTFQIILVSVACLCILHCSTSKINSSTGNVLHANDLHVMGRSAIADGRLELITSGAHFGVSFTGNQCTMLASQSGQDHSYIQYELDGVYQKRLKIRNVATDTISIIAPTSGNHTLWIYKVTEAHTGPVFIHSVQAQQLKSLSIPDKPLIEFIGNSITCGAASDPSEVPCGTGQYHDQHNAYLAYGPRVARAVNADFVLSSVSGIGIYRNWNSDRPIMPEVYEKTDLQEGSSRLWDFGKFHPKIVSIALGTNDFSRGDGKKPRPPFDSTTFIAGYVKFVRAVKAKYPQAQIVLLNSPMISGRDNDVFADCLQKIKRQTDASYPADKPVEIFLFTGMTPHGCSYHPSVEDHQQMAERLIPFFRKLL